MRTNARGFTLIELLIASVIFVVIATSIYSAFRSGMFGYRNIGAAIETAQAASFIFERLNLELRNAFIYSPDKTSGFSGTKEGLQFYALVDAYGGEKMSREFAIVSYEYAHKKLLRKVNKNFETVDEKFEITPQELPGLLDSLALSYGYLDKVKKTLEWQDSWAKESAPDEEKKYLPVAVKVELGLAGRKGEDFKRVIYLPLGGEG